MARIMVGMSGGVDSAVSAALLIEQGHDVIAGFMKNYANEENPHCTTRQDRDMALKVAQHLGIKTTCIMDFRKEYDEKIIRYIYDSYEAGLTPNPDVFCNSEVKFSLFLEESKKLGCDGIAMGHYARIGTDIQGHTTLQKGIDSNKDQSYFLSRLSQYQLQQSYFPLGMVTKPQVRELAHQYKLPNAERKDSQGLCFIGKVSIKEFLSNYLQKSPGPLIDTDGRILGQHDGIQFYTIGQRHGFGGGGGVPLYILAKQVETNTLIVGHADDALLFSQSLTAYKRHWISGEKPVMQGVFYAKIRYRQEDQEITFRYIDETTLYISFVHPQRAISSGQIVVMYQGDICLGSGIIA